MSKDLEVRRNLINEKAEINPYLINENIVMSENGLTIEYKPKMETQIEVNLKIPKKYIINKKATILFWEDGTKTIVKRSKDDEYNKRLAFLTAYFQKHCGLSKTKANEYLDNLLDEDEKQIAKALREGTLIKDVGQVFENIGNSISNYGKKLKGDEVHIC